MLTFLCLFFFSNDPTCLHCNKAVFKHLFFSCWQYAKFNKPPQTPGECGFHYVFLLFRGFFFFFSFINITHPTPKEKTVITIGSHTHKVFIRITVFGFTGFNMNAKNVWRPWNLNLLPAPLPAQLCSSLGRAWGGGGGALILFFQLHFYILQSQACTL